MQEIGMGSVAVLTTVVRKGLTKKEIEQRPEEVRKEPWLSGEEHSRQGEPIVHRSGSNRMLIWS